MLDWSEIWWSSITGPRNLCRAVARSLNGRKNVCLIVPDDLPWRDEMRACIETELHDIPDMDAFYVDFIDVRDECANVTDIGRYLLDRFANPTVASGYRRGKIQKYISESNALNNRILWIKGMGPEQERKWLQFCREYTPAGELDGRFVLEVRWSQSELERSNLAVIRYNDMISQFDLTLFNSIYLNAERRDYAPVWRQYASMLCSLLSPADAETSYALMESGDYVNHEPLDNMLSVASDDRYRRRGESNPNHILSLVRCGKESEINSLIWKAQLQVLFPLIELERLSFIDLYHSQIQDAIFANYHNQRNDRVQRVEQFGETIDDPYNVELGTICHMMEQKRDSNPSQRLLYVSNDSSHQHLYLLRNMRNLLAHGKKCPVENIREFIDSYPFEWK